MIIREKYLKWLRGVQDKRIIKVVTGVRRSGKSTLLGQFRDDLRNRGIKKSQIQSFNFEEEQHADLSDWRKLHQLIESRLSPTSMNYVFLDEIQYIHDFERLAASLATKENVDLYITGSNAFLLSSELATLLTGRYVSLHILPLSFGEYVQFYPEEYDKYKLFRQYMDSSAFPEAGSILMDNPIAANVYLNDLYDTILNKDIRSRYDIRNISVFNRIVKFVFDSIGSTISAANISNALAKQHITVSSPTVMNYLDYLTESYVLYPVSRFDIKGKHILSSNDKYYVVDLGLRQSVLGARPNSDIGHRLENIVYLELLRRQDSFIYIGKQREQEVDFVVQKYGGGFEYYQVAYQVGGQPDTLERELRPLQHIQDNYPKTLLTLDPIPADFDGINQLNLIDWLLGNR